MSLAWFGASCRGQELELQDASINTNGYFQTGLVVSGGTSFTIEVSTNLAGWYPEIGLNGVTTKTLSVIDPRPARGADRLFYRARLGTTLGFKFSFVNYAYSVANPGTPPSFPISIWRCRAMLQVENDAGFPGATNVFFTGPAGSGLTNSPSDPDAYVADRNTAAYQSLLIPPPATAGAWTVNYRGTNFTFQVPDPVDRLVIPAPAFEIELTGTLVTWVYADPFTGAHLAGAPAFMTEIQLSIPTPAYQSPNLPPSKTNQFLPFPLDHRLGWNETLFTYKESSGNVYTVTFDSLAP